MISPAEFLRLVIDRWEGKYQADPHDAGNWIERGGQRVNLGTMRGVTPAALALHKGAPASSLTVADMKAVTLEDAAEIGVKHYYEAPRFDLLTWGPATAVLLDFGWGSGPGQAVKSMQRIVGATPDGGLGPITAKAYNEWIKDTNWEYATARLYQMRCDFYRMICERTPSNSKFLQGWLNRAEWGSNKNPEFTKLWKGEPACVPL